MAGKIREIFADHWDEFMDLYGYRVRKVVKQDVERMLNCGDFSKGYAEYSCSCCGEKKKVAFRCKSRFCTTCGKIYVDERAENMSKKLIRVKHRHMVFTIPENLRVFYRLSFYLMEKSSFYLMAFLLPNMLCSYNLMLYCHII